MVAISVAVAACGGSGTPSLPAATGGATIAPGTAPSANTTQATSQAGTGTVDACALVTTAEAHAAMGVPVATAATVPLAAGHGSGCVYDSADVNRNSLSVSVNGEEKDFFDAEFGAGSPGSAPVTGVGTDAYFAVSGNTGTLAVWQNGSALEIQITDASGATTPAQIQAAATTVALAALSRL
jgi:hypothetical protein